jgi:hypothetical protein
MRDFSKGYPDRQTAGRGSLKKILAKHGIEDLGHDSNDTLDRREQPEMDDSDLPPSSTSPGDHEPRRTNHYPPPHHEEESWGSESYEQQAAGREWELIQTFRKLPKSAQFRVMASAESELERLPSPGTPGITP